jgi:small nuclear ribonucleoprotein E
VLSINQATSQSVKTKGEAVNFVLLLCRAVVYQQARPSTKQAMASYGGAVGGAPAPTRIKKVMTQAINLIYEFLKNRDRIQVWLYENTSMRIEGTLIGFDEYMNLVLDNSEEVHVKSRQRHEIGRILLKGDTICMLLKAPP